MNQGNKYFGNYRAQVADINDPEKQGRVRVKVYPMFVDLSPEECPWAEPAEDIFVGGVLNLGSRKVPDLLSWVWVFFEEGEVLKPVYFAICQAKNWQPIRAVEADDIEEKRDELKKTEIMRADGTTWSEVPSIYEVVYPKNRTIRTASGIVFEADETNGRVLVYVPSGVWFEIGKDGRMIVHMEGDKQEVVIKNENKYVKGNKSETVDGLLLERIGSDFKIKVLGKFVLHSVGDFSIRSDANIFIDGLMVKINEGLAESLP